MGSNKPESYFEGFTHDGKKYGVINCYDGHAIDADSLNEMVKHGFTNFYNVTDGCMDENYVICSLHELNEEQVKELDEHLAEENKG